MEVIIFAIMFLLKGPIVSSTAGIGKGGIDFSKVDVSKLGSVVEFDGDNSDIDDFDFGLDDLDEDDTNIVANNISPSDWVVILQNYINVLSESKPNNKIKYKIRKANELKKLEEELIKRGEDDFRDEEPEKSKCAKMEYDLLTHIHSLPVNKQKIVLDVDGDGIPDVPVMDSH